jgi:hypothetical protein
VAHPKVREVLWWHTRRFGRSSGGTPEGLGGPLVAHPKVREVLASADQGPPGPWDLLASAGQGPPGPRNLLASACQGPPGPRDL